MKISLSDSGPAFWALGNPKSLLVHLSHRNPGPVELDFERLAPDHQKQVLLGLKANNIVSDVNFDDLFAIYTKSKQPAAQTPAMTDAVKAHLKAEQERLEQEAKLKRINKLKDANEKLENKCKYILSKTVRAVKTSVSKSDNLFYLRLMLKLEQEGKSRKNVTGYIKERIDKVLAAQEKANQKSVDLTPSPETNLSPVVESKERTVVITPEMLIQSAMNQKK